MTKYGVPSFGGHIDFSDEVTIWCFSLARTVGIMLDDAIGYKGFLRSKLCRYDLPNLTMRTRKLKKKRDCNLSFKLSPKVQLFANTTNDMAIILEQSLLTPRDCSTQTKTGP